MSVSVSFVDGLRTAVTATTTARGWGGFVFRYKVLKNDRFDVINWADWIFSGIRSGPTGDDYGTSLFSAKEQPHKEVAIPRPQPTCSHQGPQVCHQGKHCIPLSTGMEEAATHHCQEVEVMEESKGLMQLIHIYLSDFTSVKTLTRSFHLSVW